MKTTVPPTWSSAMVALVVACGGGTSDALEGPNPFTTNPPTQPGEEPVLGEFAIPKRVMDEGLLWGVPRLVEGRFIMDDQLVLARGPGYPERFTARIAPSVYILCATQEVDWVVAIDELRRGSDDLSLELLDDGGLLAETVRVGSEDITLIGTARIEDDACDLPAGSEVPIEIAVRVSVFEVARSRVTLSCEAPIALAAGQALSSNLRPRVELLNDYGEAFRASNVVAAASDDLVLSGRWNAPPEPVASLAEWTTPLRSGRVTITPRLGDPVTVRVVGPELIDGAETEMQLRHIKDAVSTVAPGGTYQPEDLIARSQRATRTLLPRVLRLSSRSAGGDLCSPPPADWFQTVTNTPEVCSVGIDAADGARNTLGSGGFVGQTVTILGDGRCEVELRAPTLNSEAGFPWAWHATFVGTDDL